MNDNRAAPGGNRPDAYEVWIPFVDVCAICSDSECDGISCVAHLDPDDEADAERIDHLQRLARAGMAWIAVGRVLAHAEHRQ